VEITAELIHNHPDMDKKEQYYVESQGIDKTIIDQNTMKTDGIIISTFYVWFTRVHWLYQNGKSGK